MLLSVHPPQKNPTCFYRRPHKNRPEQNFSSPCILFILTKTFVAVKLSAAFPLRQQVTALLYEWVWILHTSSCKTGKCNVKHSYSSARPSLSWVQHTSICGCLVYSNNLQLKYSIDVTTQYQWLCKYNYARCGKNLCVCACTYVVKVIVALIQGSSVSAS